MQAMRTWKDEVQAFQSAVEAVRDHADCDAYRAAELLQWLGDGEGCVEHVITRAEFDYQRRLAAHLVGLAARAAKQSRTHRVREELALVVRHCRKARDAYDWHQEQCLQAPGVAEVTAAYASSDLPGARLGAFLIDYSNSAEHTVAILGRFLRAARADRARECERCVVASHPNAAPPNLNHPEPNLVTR